jgi:hypothetical protein
MLGTEFGLAGGTAGLSDFCLGFLGREAAPDFGLPARVDSFPEVARFSDLLSSLAVFFFSNSVILPFSFPANRVFLYLRIMATSGAPNDWEPRWANIYHSSSDAYITRTILTLSSRYQHRHGGGKNCNSLIVCVDTYRESLVDRSANPG